MQRSKYSTIPLHAAFFFAHVSISNTFTKPQTQSYSINQPRYAVYQIPFGLFVFCVQRHTKRTGKYNRISFACPSSAVLFLGGENTETQTITHICTYPPHSNIDAIEDDDDDVR